MFIPRLRRTIFATIYNTRTGPFTGRVLLLARTIAADAPCFFIRALIELFVSIKLLYIVLAKKLKVQIWLWFTSEQLFDRQIFI